MHLDSLQPTQKVFGHPRLLLQARDKCPYHITVTYTLSGNIAIGNLPVFLPVIVSIVQKDASKRLLALHAIKEVVSNCSHAQLEGVADTIWVPLFGRSEDADEATRNVAAACLGKVTATNPSRYLVQLRGRLNDPSPAVRATVLSAMRYTFADTDSQYDELLSPLIVDFLALMLDTDLVSSTTGSGSFLTPCRLSVAYPSLPLTPLHGTNHIWSKSTSPASSLFSMQKQP